VPSIFDCVTPPIETDRLVLVPLRPADAREMMPVLADPALYVFTGSEPPGLVELTSRYRAWAQGSPRAGETWHNWVIRLGPDGPAIGHLQATMLDDGRSADIAWLVGLVWQGRGYASEAAVALVGWLEACGVDAITAYVHPDNVASGRVAGNAGLAPTSELVGGEVAWRREVRREPARRP